MHFWYATQVSSHGALFQDAAVSKRVAAVTPPPLWPESGTNSVKKVIKNVEQYANPYCWITGLYIDPTSYGASNTSTDITDINGNQCYYRNNMWQTDQDDRCIKRLGYYQWIPYVLLLQGCLFYVPRLLWVLLEEGKLTAMLKGLKLGITKNQKNEDRRHY